MAPEICKKMRRNLCEKLRAKFSAATWLLHSKICPSRLCFLERFCTESKPSGRLITAAKIRKGEKRNARKETKKNEKPAHARAKMS